MMDTSTANAAADALPYPSNAPVKERTRLRREYEESLALITAEFKEWLAFEYASELPVSVQEDIWYKAWADGHSAGYNEVERFYINLAEFAEKVAQAVRNS